MTRTILPLVFAVAALVAKAGEISWTPLISSGLVRTVIGVNPRFSTLGLTPGIHDVMIPQGWKAEIFYAGSALKKPRFLAWGPDSVLFVANMSGNNILALPDTNNDGIADTAIVVTTVPGNTSSITFHRDTLYVGSETSIRKYWRTSAQGFVYDGRAVLIDKNSQQGQTGGNHKTRTVALDTNNYKIYVSVGSRGNADREPQRAHVERYDWDGSNRTIIATGIRNAVGLTIHPRTGALWANNNGSDNHGNDVPPEWMDIVREGGFYGYPFAYHDNNWFDFTRNDYKDLLPITAEDSVAVQSMVRPAALMLAHSAPMQFVFSHEAMPEPFRHGAFMALRGSWNRSPVSGTKLVFVEFDNDADTIANAIYDFCTNFIRDSTNADTRWARPVGVAVDQSGNVYMTSDDEKQFILRLSKVAASSVGVGEVDARGLLLYPNPAAEIATLELPSAAVKPHELVEDVSVQQTAAEDAAHLEVFDNLGQRALATRIGWRNTINVSQLPAGAYRVVVTCAMRRYTSLLHVVR